MVLNFFPQHFPSFLFSFFALSSLILFPPSLLISLHSSILVCLHPSLLPLLVFPSLHLLLNTSQAGGWHDTRQWLYYSSEDAVQEVTEKKTTTLEKSDSHLQERENWAQQVQRRQGWVLSLKCSNADCVCLLESFVFLFIRVVSVILGLDRPKKKYSHVHFSHLYSRNIILSSVL